jgi:hypothetical protein
MSNGRPDEHSARAVDAAAQALPMPQRTTV